MVFLSGGAGGQARSLADLILTRGGKVWLGDLSQTGVEQVVASLGGKHGVERVGGGELEVRSGEGWRTAWQNCADSLGTPDILVNIAGVKGEEDWETLYDVNLVTSVGEEERD